MRGGTKAFLGIKLSKILEVNTVGGDGDVDAVECKVSMLVGKFGCSEASSSKLFNS